MTKHALAPASVMALACLILAPSTASAQFGSIGDRLAGAAADQVRREMERMIRDGVKCTFDDEACIRGARQSGRTPIMTDGNGNVITDKDGRPVTDPDQAAGATGATGARGTTGAAGASGTAAGGGAAEKSQERPGTGAWANYDFVPGERVLAYDDYSNDRIGDFPRRWDLLAGNWEVVEWQGGRYLRATAGGAVSIELPETLPDRFTIEFPVTVQHGNAYVRVSTAPVYHGPGNARYKGSLPTFEYTRAGLRSQGGEGPMTLTEKRNEVRGDPLVNLRIMADGRYMKMYLNDHRVTNAPNAVFPRSNKIFFSVGSATEATPIMIGPVRVAAGGLELYDALTRDGRVSTQGILFAVDSDVIRPESTPTLKEIGSMLMDHAELRLAIEGHTDSDGDDAYNLDLSRRRAAAVKTFLVDTYKIDGSRLTTDGFGETRPAADNASPEGKQQNRRVELVRQNN